MQAFQIKGVQIATFSIAKTRKLRNWIGYST